MKKHSWRLIRTWWFWKEPVQECVRCKAQLRLVPGKGPRGGKRYSYRDTPAALPIIVNRIPECSFRRAGGGPPVSQGITSSHPAGTPAVGPTERVDDKLGPGYGQYAEPVESIVARYEQLASGWRAKGRAKEAEAMDEIVARLKDGTATDPRTRS